MAVPNFIFLSGFTQGGWVHYVPPGHDQKKIPGADRVKAVYEEFLTFMLFLLIHIQNTKQQPSLQLVSTNKNNFE